MDDSITQEQKQEQATLKKHKWMIYLILIWAFIGIAGFIMSIVCFGRSGDVVYDIIGLLLSMFFGPLYWLYYFIMPKSKYCGKK